MESNNELSTTPLETPAQHKKSKSIVLVAFVSCSFTCDVKTGWKELSSATSQANLRYSTYEKKIPVRKYLKFGPNLSQSSVFFAAVNPLFIQNLFQSFLLHLLSVIATHLGESVEAFPTNVFQTENKVATEYTTG